MQVVRKDGAAGLWGYLKDQFADLKTTVMDAIMDIVQSQVIQAGIKWVMGLLTPVGAFIKAAMAIIDVVKFFIQRATQIMELVKAFTDSIKANDDEFGGLMVFENSATHTNTDNQSHVDGQVKKNGSADFLYPIGDKELFRYARISAPGQNASSFTAKYFFENSNPLYPHANRAGLIDLIDNKEYWTVEKTGGSSDIMLTLSWDENTTTPAEIVVAPQSEIHIVRWNAAQNLWVDEGEVAVDSDNKTVTTVLNVDGYGVFTLARIDGGIPLSEGNIVIYNAFTPNGDGLNDYFFIDGITNYPNNTVEVYNRWGVKVFETKNYDSSGNVFNGYSNGRTTIDRNEGLPTGTYFYILNYKYEGQGITPRTIKKAGYVYINSEN